MSDPKMIREIINAVSIPVMAKVRIGHIVEAQVRKEQDRRQGAKEAKSTVTLARKSDSFSFQN